MIRICVVLDVTVIFNASLVDQIGKNRLQLQLRDMVYVMGVDGRAGIAVSGEMKQLKGWTWGSPGISIAHSGCFLGNGIVSVDYVLIFAGYDRIRNGNGATCPGDWAQAHVAERPGNKSLGYSHPLLTPLPVGLRWPYC